MQHPLLVILHQPGQQGVDVVWSGRVRTQRWGCHKRSRLGPVLAPVMGAIRPQTGSDGLTKNEGALGGKQTRMVDSGWSFMGDADARK